MEDLMTLELERKRQKGNKNHHGNKKTLIIGWSNKNKNKKEKENSH